MKTLINIVGMLLAVSAVGCANPWKANFVPNPALQGQKAPPTESVQIRTVEFERLQRYAASERESRIHSTTAPEDMSAEEKAAAKNRLLETLQLKERGDEIEVLGWSEFSTSEKLDPNSPKLSDFARQLGADYAVVAAEYMGTVARTVERPMTAFSQSYVTVAGPRGHGRTYTQSDTSTVWVPMNVLEDRFVYTAAFLRKRR
jgi:hypothetical protein